jgi:uncharacterized membrane protein AbrB (regulator of aidB expression)
MIPLIGIMIGAYIITRMLHMIIDKAKTTNVVVMVAAVITVLLSIYVIYSLITSGSELDRSFLRY